MKKAEPIDIPAFLELPVPSAAGFGKKNQKNFKKPIDLRQPT
jgi:hypothetical protein